MVTRKRREAPVLEIVLELLEQTQGVLDDFLDPAVDRSGRLASAGILVVLLLQFLGGRYGAMARANLTNFGLEIWSGPSS